MEDGQTSYEPGLFLYSII